MTDIPKAVFLSYASQDAEGARRICEALRAAGIEVWFGQNELRGVTAQLVRADNGYEVWSGVYDREIGEVIRLQDDIAASVVKALKITLLDSAAPHAASTRSADTYLTVKAP